MQINCRSPAWSLLFATVTVLMNRGLLAATPTKPPDRIAGFVGEEVTLQQDGKSFIGLYTEDATGKNKGAALIVPDLSVTARSYEFVTPLRTRLPRAGWSTLSIELPVLAAGSPRSAYGSVLEEAVKRLQAGVAHLSSKGAKGVVVIAHGIGAVAAARYLATAADPKITGFVAIGLYLPLNFDPPVELGPDLAKLAVPMLDLYGGRDYSLVRASAQARREAVVKAGKVSYTQLEIKDAQHGFQGLEVFLTNRVRGWMERRAKPAVSPSTPP